MASGYLRRLPVAFDREALSDKPMASRLIAQPDLWAKDKASWQGSQKERHVLFRKWREREAAWMDGRIDDQEFLQSAASLLGHVHHLNTRSMCRSFFWGEGRMRQQPGESWRELEQHRHELPLGVSEQQHAGQSQQQPRLPRGLEAGMTPDG